VAVIVSSQISSLFEVLVFLVAEFRSVNNIERMDLEPGKCWDNSKVSVLT
jgi:hypothetical protein